MARNTSRKTSNTTRKTTTTSTPTTKAEETPENGPQTPAEGLAAESPANGAENATEAVLDPSADPSEDNNVPDPDENNAEGDEEHQNGEPKEGDKDDDHEQKDEGEDPESEKVVSLNSADVKFTTDQYGNSLTPATPNRATSSTAYYPFEYEDGPEKDTIVAKERVHSVMRFYGTKRKGRAFAYAEGTLLNKAILDAVDHDA